MPGGIVLPTGTRQPVSTPLSAAAAGLQAVERLLEQRVAVGVAAPFADVGEVGLVGLGPRRGRRLLLVLAGRQTAAGAVPVLGDVGVAGEGDPRLVPLRAPVRDPGSRRSLTALGLTHRTCSDPRAPDRVAPSHERSLMCRSTDQQPTAALAV